MIRPRLLFILNQSIGDVILTTGVIAAVIRQYDDPRVTIVCAGVTAPLFQHVPEVEEIITIRRKKFSGHWFEIWPRLSRTRWTRIVDFRRTALSRVLRGPVSYPDRGPTRPHKVVEMSSVLGRDAVPASPILVFGPGHPTPKTGRTLVLGPGASSLYKTWPAERFGEAATRLTGPDGVLAGARVIVTGGPMDQAAARTIADHVGVDRTVDLTGADLMATADAMHGADLFMGNDSGMTHLSAAAGAPTLALFGPTDDSLYRPWGDRARIVSAPREEPRGETAEPSDDDAVMRALSVDRVVAAAEVFIRDIK